MSVPQKIPRSQLLKIMSGDYESPPPPSPAAVGSLPDLSQMMADILPTEKKDNGIFDIPILGPALDLLDTPRAAIVSGLKEIGDIFDAEESFSVRDWWDQTGDNIFMGEVLRDWGVDLPGPLDFALGLTLDIAFDPLTYLLPLGAVGRLATKKQLRHALQNGIKTLSKTPAAAAKNKQLIGKYEQALKNSHLGIYAAGKEVLEDLGVDTAVKFSLPLSGRIGRGVFERPLRNIPGVGPKYAQWADTKRVGQLNKILTGSSAENAIKQGIRVINLNDPATQQRVLKAVQQINAAKGKSGRIAAAQKIKGATQSGPQIVQAAEVARRMPIELPIKIGKGFGTLAAVAALPGKVMGNAQKTKLMNTVSKGLSSRFELNQMYRSGNIEDIRNAMFLEDAGNRSLIKEMIFVENRVRDLSAMGNTARREGISFDDVFRAANETMGTPFAAAIDPRFGPLAEGGVSSVQELPGRLITFFREALDEYNAALPFKEDLEGFLAEVYITRQMAFENLELVGDGTSFKLPDTGLTGTPFKSRELHLPDEIKALKDNGLIRQEEIDRIEAAFEDTFEEILRKGTPIEVATTDGRLIRNRFMGQGFVYKAEGGSVLTQMQKIGEARLGDNYKELFTNDSVAALQRYINMMGEQIRAQSIIGDLNEVGIIVKANDDGRLANLVGRDLYKKIEKATARRTQKVKKKIKEEQAVATSAETIAKYIPDEATEALGAVARSADEVRTGDPEIDRFIEPSIDVGRQFGKPLSVEEVMQDVAPNAKGRAAMKARVEENVNLLNETLVPLREVSEAITAVKNGDPSVIESAGARRLLEFGEAPMRRPSGQFGPKVRPLVPEEGTARYQRAKRFEKVTEEDLDQAVSHLNALREELELIQDTWFRLEEIAAGEMTNARFIAEVENLGNWIKENREALDTLFSNFTRNLLETDTSVKAAQILDEMSHGAFGDIEFFKLNKPTQEAQENYKKLQAQVERQKERITASKTFEIDLGGGAEAKEWWEAYKAANPNWDTQATMVALTGKNKIVLRDVGELQAQRLQKFTDDWISQRTGQVVADRIPTAVTQTSPPPNWTGALTMGAENWPASAADDFMRLIANELSDSDSFVLYSTGPRVKSGTTNRVRPTDGGMSEYRGSDFTISQASAREWVLSVDGNEIPISGSRTTTNKAGDEGLVVWLPKQQRLVRFNAASRKVAGPKGVKAVSKQKATAAKKIGQRIDEATAKAAKKLAAQERELLRLEFDQYAASEAASLTYTENVYEAYRLGMYATDELGNAVQFAPVPRAKYVIDEVEVVMPGGVPVRRDVFAVNAYTDEVWIYRDARPVDPDLPRKTAKIERRKLVQERIDELATTKKVTENDIDRIEAEVRRLIPMPPAKDDPYYPKGERGQKLGHEFVGGRDHALVMAKPASGAERLGRALEGGLYELVEIQPAPGTFTSRLELSGSAYLEGRSASRQLRSRWKQRGWVFLDGSDDASVAALEAGTYVPPAKLFKRTSPAEQAAVEAVFNTPVYRDYIKQVQELKKVQDEVFEVENFHISFLNQSENAVSQHVLRSQRATEAVIDAEINMLDDQIRAGVKGNAGAVNNRARIQELEARKESLEVFVEEALTEVSKTRQYLAKSVPQYNKSVKKVTEVTEEQLAIINTSIVHEQKIIQDIYKQIDDALVSARKPGGRGTASEINYAKDQQEAMKFLNTARRKAGLADAYEDMVNGYLMNSETLGKATESSSRTKQHLRGYTLVNANEESVELFEAAYQSMARLRDPIETGNFMRGYNKLVNYWKAQAVATTGFVFRNQLGGTWINNQIAGVPISTQIRVDLMRAKALKRAKADGRPGDVAYGVKQLSLGKESVPIGFGLSRVTPEEWDVMHEWVETGMANTGVTSMEVKSAINESSLLLRDHIRTAQAWKPYAADNWLFAGIGRFNQRAEFSLRGGLAHHIMTGGGTTEDALLSIYKYHFDYTNLTHWDQRIKRVIPFWTWQKNILPVLIESLGKRPQAWARLVQVKGELELTSEKEGLVPDYFGENMGIRLPFKTNGSRVYALPDLPFRDLARYLKSPTAPARGVVESALPFYKLPIEIWAGKRTFADIPFTGRYQQVPLVQEKLPGLMPLLQVFGKAKKSSTGEWMMRDQDIYAIDQFMPILGRARRLAPNEEAKQRRVVTTYISTLFGLGLRANTPQEKRNQLIKDKVRHSKEMRDVEDILFRRV